MTDKLSASEALFMFAGWLTALNDPVTFSGRHEAGIAAELVGEFCKANNLEAPRESWPALGVWPQTRKLLDIGDDPIEPLAIQDP